MAGDRNHSNDSTPTSGKSQSQEFLEAHRSASSASFTAVNKITHLKQVEGNDQHETVL